MLKPKNLANAIRFATQSDRFWGALSTWPPAQFYVHGACWCTAAGGVFAAVQEGCPWWAHLRKATAYARSSTHSAGRVGVCKGAEVEVSLSPATCCVTFGTGAAELHLLHYRDSIRCQWNKVYKSLGIVLEHSNHVKNVSTDHIYYYCTNFYYYCFYYHYHYHHGPERFKEHNLY